MSELSAVDKYKKALEHAEGIKQSAVEELKKDIEAKIHDLNAFGFTYHLTGTGSARATRKRAASDKPKHCEICNIAGHDARNHRSQEPKKKFTKAELDAKGLRQHNQ